MRRFVRGAALLSASLLAVSGCTSGASPSSRHETGTAAAVLAGESPRGALGAYLAAARHGDYAAAAAYLDLSALPSPEREEKGLELARELEVVLDRTLWVDLETLSDRPEGLETDGLPPDRDRIGTVRVRGGAAVAILLARLPGPDGRQVWRIASSTVAHIPELYAQHGYPAFVDRLPREFVEWRFLDTDLWQWLGLIAFGLAAWAVAFLLTRLLRRAVLLFAHRTETDLDDRIADALHRPLRLTVTLCLFLAGSWWLRLAVPVRGALSRSAHGLAVVLVTWMCTSLVDILTRSAQERMLREDRRSAVSMLTLGRRAAKIVVVALGFLGLLQGLGFNVTGLVAGLGIGGVAIAFAAQKTIENVFGGVALTMDRPIRVGDFCRFGTQQGVVEDVGLRSTRIRTLDRTVVTVPNAALSAVEIENFTVRDRFRLLATIGVRYETAPDQLRALIAAIRDACAAHPKVIPDPLRVRFVGFGASALEIEIFTYVGTADANEFFAIREELLLRIMELVAEAGTGFAFPTQTLYLGRDLGVGTGSGKARATPEST